MFEIIAVIFLTGQMGRLAARKGLRAGRWQLYTVLAWLSGEFIGAITGVMIFGTDNIFSIIMVALAGAITGYLILKRALSKKPDIEHEIDRIGMP